METEIKGRWVIVFLSAAIIVFITSWLFDSTQSFYKIFAQGKKYFEQSNYPKALPYFNLASEIQPANPDNIRYLLWTYQRLDMKKEAGELAEIILKTKIRNTYLLEELADIYYRFSDYKEAEQLYRKLLSVKKSFGIRRKLAQVIVWQKRYAEAMPILEGLNKEKPGDLEAAEILADTYAWLKKYEAAVKLYKKLISRRFNAKEVSFKLAENLRLSGQDMEAVNFYKRYLAK